MRTIISEAWKSKKQQSSSPNKDNDPKKDNHDNKILNNVIIHELSDVDGNASKKVQTP